MGGEVRGGELEKDNHTEHLTFNVFLEPGDPLAANALGLRRMDDAANSINRRLVDVQL